MKRHGRKTMAVALGLYLVTLGVLGGVLVERLRYDRERAEVLARYDGALAARNARLIELEIGQ